MRQHRRGWFLHFHLLCMREAKALERLHEYAQAHLSLWVADVINIKITCSCPYIAHTYPYISSLSKGFSLKHPSPGKGHELRNFHQIGVYQSINDLLDGFQSIRAPILHATLFNYDDASLRIK